VAPLQAGESSVLDEHNADDAGAVSRSFHKENDIVRVLENSCSEGAQTADNENMEVPKLASEGVHYPNTHDGHEMCKSVPRSWLGKRMALGMVFVRSQLLPKQILYYR